MCSMPVKNANPSEEILYHAEKKWVKCKTSKQRVKCEVCGKKKYRHQENLLNAEKNDKTYNCLPKKSCKKKTLERKICQKVKKVCKM